MSEVTINRSPVTRGTVYLPARGVWVADLDVDTETAPAGRVALAFDDVTLSGTVVTGDMTHGLWRGRIVGGAGGLRAMLPARAYRAARLADVLADALSEAGEALAAGSDALDIVTARWHRTAGPAHDTVRGVADAAGLTWRVTLAGAVWIGAETWPDASPDVDLVDRDPRAWRYTLSGDVALVTPGLLLSIRDESGDTFLRTGAVRWEIDGRTVTAVVYA